MLRARWMILAGALFVLGGLANSFFGGVRQPSSPLDLADGISSGSDQGFAPVSVQAGAVMPAMAPTVESESGQPGLATPTPEAGSPAPVATGYVPDRLEIPAIGLDAPVVLSQTMSILYDGNTYSQWVAPDEFAAGWQDGSALLGVPGNTVLNGHHNVHGKVFENLVRLQQGDIIQVYSGEKVFRYAVALKILLPERYQPLDVRIDNARWIMPSTDERLTLITCWPLETNTHRVVIVAFPVKADSTAALASATTVSRLASSTPNLKLTPVCGPDSAQSNYWRVENPAAYDVPIEWYAFPGGAPAGTNFVRAGGAVEFTTPKQSAKDALVLYSGGIQIGSRSAAQGCK